MGFSAAVPLILKERGASFSDIALFGVSSLPFSAKLFWAPIVDSVYLESVGRFVLPHTSWIHFCGGSLLFRLRS